MSKTAREQAFEILLKIEKDKAYSNLALDYVLKSETESSTDRAFVTRLVYGVTERRITLDRIYSQFLNQGMNKLKAEVLTLLRLGTFQIVFSDKIPKSAAVNETVKTANKKCKYASGMINAVLRKIESTVPDFEFESDTERLSFVYSVPKELVNFFVYHYGIENTEGFFKETLKEKSVFVKMNNTKTNKSAFLGLLNSECDSVKETVLDDSFEISSKVPVFELESYKKGFFHVEDISSQLCVKALSPQENERVLDVCGAPGGKSFTIAEHINNKGSVVSCDIYPQRAELIEKGARRLGLFSVKPLVNDATVFNEDLGLFDRVLCDVPCSGLGIIGKKPEIKYKNLDDIKDLIPIQKKILDVSSGYVKKGGTLVYSTCSVNPNENRRVCDEFLKHHTDFSTVKVLPELTRCRNEGDYLTLMPHINKCDGFFIAKFVRN